MTKLLKSDQKKAEERKQVGEAALLAGALFVCGVLSVGSFLAGYKLDAERSIEFKTEAIRAHATLDSLATKADRILRGAMFGAVMTRETQELMLDLVRYRDEMNAEIVAISKLAPPVEIGS